MGIKIPWSWQNKPPRGVKIDRSHPMAKDLVFFAAMHHGNGYQQDLITGRIGTHVNDTDGKIHYNRREGVFIEQAGSQTTGWQRGWDFGLTPGDGSDPWEIDYGTVIARARPDAAVPAGFHSANSRIISMADNANGTDDYALTMDDNSGANNRIELRVRDSSGVGPMIVLQRASGDYLGVLLDLAIDCRPGPTGNVDGYAWEPETNAYLESLANDFTGPIGKSGEGLMLAGRRFVTTGGERYIGGAIEYAAVFNVPKGYDFINAFRQNPWQIFEPFELDADTGVVVDDVANSGETPGSGSESWVDGSAGNVITGLGFYDG